MLTSSGAAWHAHLSENLRVMGFILTPADPVSRHVDAYRYCTATREDGIEHYEYLFCYVDDVIIIS